MRRGQDLNLCVCLATTKNNELSNSSHNTTTASARFVGVPSYVRTAPTDTSNKEVGEFTAALAVFSAVAPHCSALNLVIRYKYCCWCPLSHVRYFRLVPAAWGTCHWFAFCYLTGTRVTFNTVNDGLWPVSRYCFSDNRRFLFISECPAVFISQKA